MQFISFVFIKLFLLGFGTIAQGQSNGIHEFFQANKLPYPSDTEILNMMSALKKDGKYSFIGTPVVYKYDLAKIMQVLPEQHQGLLRQGPCAGRDQDVYVMYDKVDPDKRISFRYLCTNICVAVIEKVGRANQKGFRPTKAMSPAVSVDEKLCQVFADNDRIKMIDKMNQSIVD